MVFCSCGKNSSKEDKFCTACGEPLSETQESAADDENGKVVRKCYRDILKREPDEFGFNHFLNQMKKKEIDEKKLTDILSSSEEYKRLSYKEQFTKKYDMEKNFYGKIWVGQDYMWFAEIFTHLPLLHKDCLNFIQSKKDIKTVLEIGCGAGVYPIQFKEELFSDKEYTGIDISESGIYHCKTNSNFDFICGDFLKMNLSKKYDLVFSNNVIDNVYDIDMFISKIVQLCGKYAYISAYNGYYPGLIKHERTHFENDGYYLNKLSVAQIKQTLLRNGLREEEFVVRPQESGHKEIKKATIIEIQRRR